MTTQSITITAEPAAMNSAGPGRSVVEAGAADRRLHPAGLRRLLAGRAASLSHRRRRREMSWPRCPPSLVVGVSRSTASGSPPAPAPGPPARSQTHRAVRDRRHHHRAGRILRAARHRHRRRPLRLGAAVHRDHHRTAAAVARPPRPHPPLPPGRLGADHRTGDARRHDVGLRARRDHGHRRRRPPARHRRRRLPRPRELPARRHARPPGSARRPR